MCAISANMTTRPHAVAPTGTLPMAPPSGMHDLLPPEAEAHAQMRAAIMEIFAHFGYERVVTPPFEHAEVLERGIETVDRRDLLRFVEPETGEVALLRPDITPQIARIIATRLNNRPAPHRLCYVGTVMRRRRGRARRQQQIAQTGIECVGIAGVEADVEVIEVAARACEAVGLRGFRIELGQVGVARAALAEVPEDYRSTVAAALAAKDRLQLDQTLRAAGLKRPARQRVVALAELYGDPSIIRQARRSLRGEPTIENALDELERVVERASERLGERLLVDLGELRGQAYYTGVSFNVLASGPGESVGTGGRYDALLARYGQPFPATGMALHLGNLAWALAHEGRSFEPDRALRVVVVGQRPEVDELRARGVEVSLFPEELAGSRALQTALAYARAWSYDLVLLGKTPKVTRVSTGETFPLGAEGSVFDALTALMESD